MQDRVSTARRCGRGGWAVVALVLVGALLADCRWLRREKTLAISLDRVPATLDPQHHNEIVGWCLLCNFYDALVRFSPEMRVEPALATFWLQVDATHVRFNLRQGVHFANGESCTSGDVVASFQRALRDPQSKIRHHLVGISRLVAESDTSLLLETNAPAPTLLNRLAFLFVIPRSQTDMPEIRQPIGTGPDRFIKQEADGSILAEGWASWRGQPAIGRVRFSFIEDEDKRSERFANGGMDVSVRVNDDLLADVQRRPGLRVRPQPNLQVQHLAVVRPHAEFGAAGRALADVRVRRALLLAIDREGLVNRVFRGNGTVASQFVHPVVFGYDPTLSLPDYDPERARRLLAEAGFPEGFAADFAHGAIPPAYVTGIVHDLGRIGVRLRPVQFPLRELLRRARAGEFPLVTYGRACTTGDASEFLDSSIHTGDATRGLGFENYSGYSDPETDTLLEAADRELDASRRLALLQRAQRRVLEALPILPLTLRTEFLGTSSRVDVVTRYDGWLWVAAFRWER